MPIHPTVRNWRIRPASASHVTRCHLGVAVDRFLDSTLQTVNIEVHRERDNKPNDVLLLRLPVDAVRDLQRQLVIALNYLHDPPTPLGPPRT